jgi:hypothetical protein
VPERSRPQLRRSTFLAVLTTAVALEAAWTVYIGWRLPREYVANHWDLAWVGVDVAQLLMLTASAWAAWRRRALLILFASCSGTLLLVDAWFDVTTARRGDFRQSLAMAIFVEIPSAIILFWVTSRAVGLLARQVFAGTPLRRIRIPSPLDVGDSGDQS